MPDIIFHYNPPLNYPYRVSSPFGPRGEEWHYGTDFVPLRGHDGLLRAVGNGVVTREGWHDKSGWYVWMQVGFIDYRKYQVLYAHCAHRCPVEAGRHFDIGQWMGTIGATGDVRPPGAVHLHCEVRDDNGFPRDPEIWFENVRLISIIRQLEK